MKEQPPPHVFEHDPPNLCKETKKTHSPRVQPSLLRPMSLFTCLLNTLVSKHCHNARSQSALYVGQQGLAVDEHCYSQHL